MARDYRPSAPFNVPVKLLVPVTSKEYGVVKKAFTTPEESNLIFVSFKTFGGTEYLKDNVYTVIDTAVIETWYRPDIKSDCRIYECETGQIYEILGDPENIDFRHQYLKFKVRKTGGKP